MSLYASLVKPALFALDAERAHNLTLALLGHPLGRSPLRLMPQAAGDARLRQRAFGLDFRNPIGLAAGLDKQGTAVAAWDALGFGFAEIGTVTPRSQPGNPRPRLFRLPADHAVINRFGFNSEGAAAVAGHLAESVSARAVDSGAPSTAATVSAPRQSLETTLRLGINVGKNKDTANEQAADDYVASIEALHRFADYIVVNVSSPNTVGLRALQESAALRPLMERVVACVAAVSPRRIPVLVKVSPDMDPAQLLASVDAACAGGAAGIIATNTTIGRTGLRTTGAAAAETGGLSGAPLRVTANEICARLFAHVGGRVPIVGVGGIFSAADAYERIRAGASLIQIYTGLIYEGPSLVARIASGLAERLARDGFSNVRDAVGADVG